MIVERKAGWPSSSRCMSSSCDTEIRDPPDRAWPFRHARSPAPARREWLHETGDARPNQDDDRRAAGRARRRGRGGPQAEQHAVRIDGPALQIHRGDVVGGGPDDSSSRCRSTSARLRSVRSMCVPDTRSGWPFSSRSTTEPRVSTHFHRPSFMRNRCSVS